MKAARREKVYRSGSVELAGRALLELANRGSVMGVRELARALNVSASSLGRVVASLENVGLVAFDARHEKYGLGHAVLRLSASYARQSDLALKAYPVMEDIASATKETVCLNILRARQCLAITQIESPHDLRMTTEIGRPVPLHASAGSRAMLAFLPPETVDEILSGPLEAITPNTPTDVVAIREELRRIVERGFATSLGELELGAAAIAAPIRDQRGAPVASLGVFGPEARLTRDVLAQLGPAVVRAAVAVSAALGDRTGSLGTTDETPRQPHSGATGGR